MSKSILFILAVFIMAAYGCCSKNNPILEPIAGRWVFHDDNGQNWIYDFSADKVDFRIDDDKTSWKIIDVSADDEGFIYIEVDSLLGRGASQDSQIVIERLVGEILAISSGMHEKMLFEKK